MSEDRTRVREVREEAVRILRGEAEEEPKPAPKDLLSGASGTRTTMYNPKLEAARAVQEIVTGRIL